VPWRHFTDDEVARLNRKRRLEKTWRFSP